MKIYSARLMLVFKDVIKFINKTTFNKEKINIDKLKKFCKAPHSLTSLRMMKTKMDFSGSL